MKNNLKEVFITRIRDKSITINEFRILANRLGHILAQEASEFLEIDSVEVATPIENTVGKKFKNPIVLVPILRSGLTLVDPFIQYFEEATIGCIGLKRDEITAIAHLYYKNLPTISKDSKIIILDPMIATGGSALSALEILTKDGIKEENMIFACIICSKEGIENIKNKYPKLKIINIAQDKELNQKKFIIPGLGDFGDRYFGTLK